MSMLSRFSSAALVLFAFPLLAQQTSYSTILLPVSPSTVRGEGGAQWVTELTLANTGFEPISLFCFTPPCSELQPRTVVRQAAPEAAAVRPSLLHVPNDVSRRLNAALRARNTTPNSDERDFISEIPVARAEDFRSGVIELLAIPIEANYRHMLRVYDASATEGARVRVRIYGLSRSGERTAEPLYDGELTLQTPRGTRSPFALPDEPSWAALGNFSDLPGVRNFPEAHIRIETLGGALELWAFATATNNTTQRFAVYTP